MTLSNKDRTWTRFENKKMTLSNKDRTVLPGLQAQEKHRENIIFKNMCDDQQQRQERDFISCKLNTQE